MDSHEAQQGIDGLWAVQPHALREPVLDPRPTLSTQLLLGRLMSDKVVVLIRQEPVDTAQGT